MSNELEGISIFADIVFFPNLSFNFNFEAFLAIFVLLWVLYLTLFLSFQYLWLSLFFFFKISFQNRIDGPNEKKIALSLNIQNLKLNYLANWSKNKQSIFRNLNLKFMCNNFRGASEVSQPQNSVLTKCGSLAIF